MKNLFPEILEQQLYEEEKLEMLKTKLSLISSWMALPLFFLFWICDIIYVPHLKWEFLGLRAFVIPFHFLAQNQIPRIKKLWQAEALAVSMAGVYSFIISSMIFILDDFTSPYYAGLNLIALGGLPFVPFRPRFFGLIVGVLFGPYFIGSALLAQSSELAPVIMNMFFIIGTAAITLVISIIHERLQIKEFNNRLLLNQELDSRERVIEAKTKEGLRLATLSSQFSPQIIEAIKNGERLIDTKRHRAEISAIFIDVVSSTDRLVRLDHRDFIEAIEYFMEICINTLLKYDLTIDKFYGDGVLAFANDPVRRTDYIERTCLAALEIRQQIIENQNYLRTLWKTDFQVTMGISSGFSSVGFYGNTTYIKQYSAIGTCLPMSQRLSSIAKPNEILVDHTIYSILKRSNFKLESRGEQKLKGFEDDVFQIFNLVASDSDQQNQNYNSECPKCHANSVFIDEDEGIYILKCRKCGDVRDSIDDLDDSAA